jgi:hypothetical protein
MDTSDCHREIYVSETLYMVYQNLWAIVTLVAVVAYGASKEAPSPQKPSYTLSTVSSRKFCQNTPAHAAKARYQLTLHRYFCGLFAAITCI